MNPVTREQWTTALRSGEYIQGRGQLRHNSGGYCCLGVLMSLAGAKPIVTPPGLKLEGYDFPYSAHLPRELIDMVGISMHTQTRLVTMNDMNLRSFADIADYIDSLPFEPSEPSNEPRHP